MQLYAKIKRSSKYYSQNDWAENQPERWGGLPFRVSIDPEKCYDTVGDDYAVQGGPGGQYRLDDVNLFIKRSDGKPIRIS